MSKFGGFSKPVLLFDFESTGFVRNDHGDVVDPGQPTQLGAVLLHPKTLVEESSFVSDIQADPDKLDPWVLEHTDITAERLRQAPEAREVAGRFMDQFSVDVYLASWNVVFDQLWLDRLMQSVGRRASMYDYHHLDVWSLAYGYLSSWGYSDVIRSEATFKFFGQSNRSAHNALDDCRRTAEVLRAVLFDTGVQS